MNKRNTTMQPNSIRPTLRRNHSNESGFVDSSDSSSSSDFHDNMKEIEELIGSHLIFL